MTEQDKQAIRDEFDKYTGGVDAQQFLDRIEAHLSFEHPPKGTICEVNGYLFWAGEDGLYESYDQNRTWLWSAAHYRVIPTAKDALAVVEKIIPKCGLESQHVAIMLARDAIQSLIDNAQEG